MSTAKKPGGKPGNKNALKHGLYSRFILNTDVAGLEIMSEKSIADEIAMARVNFSNAMQELNQATSSAKKLDWNFAAHYWLETVINAVLRSKEQSQAASVVWTSFQEAIRAANDKQGVR